MALKQGTRLQGGKYQIINVLTQDDTVINYQALCRMINVGSSGKDKKVVNVMIKELFLMGYYQRDDAGNVIISDQANSKLVESSKRNFKEMATNLASMKKADGTPQVTDIFEENNTIYYVMPLLSASSADQREMQGVPQMVSPRSMSTPPEPAEVAYGYSTDNSSKRKKRVTIIASILGLLTAAGVALYVFNPWGRTQTNVVDSTDTTELTDTTVTGNEARERVVNDVAEINKNLPNALNDHMTMVSAIYDREQNVLTITYEVTNSTDLKEQKENIRTGMLNGLKSNDNTGKHFREALITVKECFMMNGSIIDQFVLTPEDYSRIRI